MSHDRFSLVPASYVYLLREGDAGTEVLLQLRGDVAYMPRHWAAAAAGHVERGETAYDAARREAAEEIGVEPLDLELVTAMQRTAHAEPVDERIDFHFTARHWTGEPRLLEPHKAAELRWCRLADLPDPTVPHERYVLEHLAAGLPAYTTFGFDPAPAGARPSPAAPATAGGNP